MPLIIKTKFFKFFIYISKTRSVFASRLVNTVKYILLFLNYLTATILILLIKIFHLILIILLTRSRNSTGYYLYKLLITPAFLIFIINF